MSRSTQKQKNKTICIMCTRRNKNKIKHKKIKTHIFTRWSAVTISLGSNYSSLFLLLNLSTRSSTGVSLHGHVVGAHVPRVEWRSSMTQQTGREERVTAPFVAVAYSLVALWLRPRWNHWQPAVYSGGIFNMGNALWEPSQWQPLPAGVYVD